MPAKLLLVPWVNVDAPCNTYDCYNRIAWKLVPAVLVDNTGAIIMGLCDECREALRDGFAGHAEELPEEAPVVATTGRRR